MAGVTFDNMKKNKMTNYSTIQIMNHKVSPFMRKGTEKNVRFFFFLRQFKPFITDFFMMISE